jgi:hypothetical protein
MAEKLGGFQDLIRLLWETLLETLTKSAIRRRNVRFVVYRNVVEKTTYHATGRLGPGF